MNKKVSGLALAIILLIPKESSSEPVSMSVAAGVMLAQAAISTAVNEFVHWGLSPAKGEVEYAEQHSFRKNLTTDDFLHQIEILKNLKFFSEQKILAQHEMYRYPNFVDAIRETCPGYAGYIKKLLRELTDNYHARDVKGFGIRRSGIPFLSRLRSLNAADEYEFFELVKNLAAHVAQAEAKELQEKIALFNELYGLLDCHAKKKFMDAYMIAHRSNALLKQEIDSSHAKSAEMAHVKN